MANHTALRFDHFLDLEMRSPLEILRYLQKKGLIASRYTCPNCKGNMRIQSRKDVSDKYRWRCPVCQSARSLRGGSWFEMSNLSLIDILKHTYYWVHRYKEVNVMWEMRCGEHTILNWWKLCRDICSEIVRTQIVKIGGPGVVVELGESRFGHDKYYRGKCNGYWVLGGVQRESNQCFIRVMKDRTPSTLVSIVRENVLPGTTLISACWEHYSYTDSVEFTNLTLSYVLVFRNTEKGAHTNNLESMWRALKRTIPLTNITLKMFSTYLAEFVYRKLRADAEDPYLQFLEDISTVHNSASSRRCNSPEEMVDGFYKDIDEEEIGVGRDDFIPKEDDDMTFDEGPVRCLEIKQEDLDDFTAYDATTPDEMITVDPMPFVTIKTEAADPEPDSEIADNCVPSIKTEYLETEVDAETADDDVRLNVTGECGSDEEKSEPVGQREEISNVFDISCVKEEFVEVPMDIICDGMKLEAEQIVSDGPEVPNVVSTRGRARKSAGYYRTLNEGQSRGSTWENTEDIESPIQSGGCTNVLRRNRITSLKRRDNDYVYGAGIEYSRPSGRASRSTSITRKGVEKGVTPPIKRSSYTANQKLKVIIVAEQLGNRKASCKFNINEANIRQWRKCKESLIRQNKLSRAAGPGKKALNPEMESRLLEYLREKKASGQFVCALDIRRKALCLMKELDPECTFKASTKWCLLFTKRHSI